MSQAEKERLAILEEKLKVLEDGTKEKCEALLELAQVELKGGDHQTALRHYKDSHAICKQRKDCEMHLSDIYVGLGECNIAAGNYSEAEYDTIAALVELSKKEGRDTSNAVKLFYSLGKIYRLSNDISASKKVIGLALPISENIKNNKETHHVIDLLNEMAISYYAKQQIKLANRIFIGIIDVRKNRFGKTATSPSRNTTSYGEMLRSQGKVDDALNWYKEGLESRKTIDSLESTKDSRLSIADSYSNLGLIYRGIGKFDEAETNLMNALDIRREELNGRGALIGSTLNNIAELYRDRGQFGQALMFHETCINTFKACLSPDHPNLINARGNLGVTLRHQARSGNLTGDDLIKTAMNFFKENNYGNDHPWVKKFKLESYYSKANELSEDGDFDKAIELYKVLIESKRFSEESRIMKMIMKELWVTSCKKAVFLRDQGRFREAKALFRACMDESEKYCDSNDQIMCEYTFAQAETLRQMGLTEDAVELYGVLMKIRVEQFGERHPLIARLKNALAICEMEKGNYLEAKTLFKESLEIINEAIDLESETVLVDKFNFKLKAIVLTDFSELNRRMSSFFKAKDKQDKSLELKMKYFGLHSNEVADSYYLNAKILYSIGRLEAAETFNNKAYDIWTHIFDSPEHPKIANALILSSLLDTENGNHGRARQSVEKAMKVYEDTYPPEYPSVVYGIYASGKALAAAGMYRQADKLFQRAHSISIQTIGQFSALAGLCSYANGKVHTEIGNYEVAAKHYRDALTIQEHSLGKYHPDYFETLLGKANNQRLNDQFDDASVVLEEAEKLLNMRDTAYATSSSRTANIELNSKEKLPVYATFVIAKAKLAASVADFDKAEKLFESALAMRVKMYGEHHQYVYAVKHDILEVWCARGMRADDMLSLFIENKSGMARHWGEDHPLIANMEFAMADFRVRFDKCDIKTKANLMECSYVAIRCQGKLSVFYANIMTTLGEMMIGEELFEESRQYFEEAEQIYSKLVGKAHSLYGKLQNSVSELYRLQRLEMQSKEFNELAFDIISGSLGEDHPFAQNVAGNTGLIMMLSDSTRSDGVSKVREAHKVLADAGYTPEHPWMIKFQEAMEAAEADNMSVRSESQSVGNNDNSVERLVDEMEAALDSKTDEIIRLTKANEEKDAMLSASRRMEEMYSTREAEMAVEMDELRRQLEKAEGDAIDERKKVAELELDRDKVSRVNKELVRSQTMNDKLVDQQQTISELEEKIVFLENKLSINSNAAPLIESEDQLQLTISLALKLKQEVERLTEKSQVDQSGQAEEKQNESNVDNGSVVSGEDLIMAKEEASQAKRQVEELKRQLEAAEEYNKKHSYENRPIESAASVTEANAKLQGVAETAFQSDDEKFDLLTSLSVRLKEDLDAAKAEVLDLRRHLEHAQTSKAGPSNCAPGPDHDESTHLELVMSLSLKLKEDLDASICEAHALRGEVSRMSGLLEEKEALEANSLNDNTSALQEELENARREVSKLTSEVEDSKRAAQQLEDQLKESEEKHAQEVASFDKSLADLKAASAMIESDDSSKQLHAALMEANTREKDLKNESEDLSRTLKVKNAEVEALRNSLKSSSLEVKDANKEAEYWKKESQTIGKERFMIQQYVQSSDEKISALESSLTTCSSTCESQSTKIQSLQDDIAKANKAKSQMTEELNECKKKLQNLETSQSKSKSNEIAEKTLRDEIASLKSKYDSEVLASRSMTEEAERWKKSNAKLEEEMKQIQSKLQQEVQSNQDNSEALRSTREKLRSAQKELHDAKLRSEKLAEESEEFSRKRSNLESLINHLKKENESKSEEIEHHLSTISSLENRLKDMKEDKKILMEQTQHIRDEIHEKRLKESELLHYIEELKEKLEFSNNQRKSMDPWGFLKEAELGLNRFDTRLRPRVTETPTGPARHVKAPLSSRLHSEDHEETRKRRGDEASGSEGEVISSHIDDLMLGSVPSRHFTSARNVFAKDDRHRLVLQDSPSPTSPLLPDIFKKPPSEEPKEEGGEYDVMTEDQEYESGEDFDELLVVHPSPLHVRPGSESASGPQTVSFSPISRYALADPNNTNDHPPSSSEEERAVSSSMDKTRTSSAHSEQKTLKRAVQKKKKKPSFSATAPPPSSQAKVSPERPVPTIKRVNNYVDLLPEVKKFGVYGCLDSMKDARQFLTSPEGSRVSLSGSSKKERSADDPQWLDDSSLMESVRLEPPSAQGIKETFVSKPKGLW